ncbi:MAG TPA: protein kinase [Actinomycetota bacterium]|nr:protein kinase [Actinomycetota bacterium]
MTSDLGPASTFGPYRIESLLGRGGMSVVYLAEDTRLGRRVAIKVLAPELAADEAFRSRFVRESQLAAGLDHPNIVPVFEAGETDGQLYIAMRYVRGTDLRTLIVREGPLDPERTVELLRPVASALDAAHRRGLVHRDVKPANILIASDEGEEHVYLSDFGLTKHASSRSGLTRTGQFMGTVDYVAPEQIQGQDVDGRADEYSLACVLYESLTGNVPYAKDSDVATLFGHIQDPPPKVTDARPTLPGELDETIARAMAKDPADRFPTCAAMIVAAAGALGAPSGPRETPATGIAMPAPVEPFTPPTSIPSPLGGPPSAPPADGPPSDPAYTPPPGIPVVTPSPSRPTPAEPTARSGIDRKLVGMFAAGGVALAAIIVIVGLALSGGDDDPGPGPITGPDRTAPTGPPPPIAASNEASIRIVDAASADPYPSSIPVTAERGSVADVNVTLEGFAHAFPDDVAVLLVGPDGRSAVLMSDSGGGSTEAVRDVNLTFDDEAQAELPDAATISAGSYRPTAGTEDGGGLCCGFTGAGPAPAPPYGADLSVFDGSDPNGDWQLFVVDDSGGDDGRIAGGWSIGVELSSDAPSTGPTGATSPTGATTDPPPTGPTGSSVVFRDDFSDVGSGWDTFEDATSSGGYRDGEYVLSVDGGFLVTGDLNTRADEIAGLTDVRVEVTGRLLTAPNAVYGVTCRARSTDRYYYFLIQGDGSYYIGEAVPRRAENLATGTSAAILAGRTPNRIGAECLDAQGGVALRLYVNGELVDEAVDGTDPLGAGRVGLRTESRRDEMSAAFDDLVVSVP